MSDRTNQWRASVFSLAGVVSLLGGCVTSGGGALPDVPASLKVPASQTVSRWVRASGVQIYDCKPGKDDPAQFAWVFRAPEAELRDRAGKPIGKHYAGPTWEANDGSRVVGEVVARDSGPDATAIPWLLLRVASVTGDGIFRRTQSIQRLHTAGGKAPADGCGQAQNGQETRVAYTADYVFYVDRR